MADETAKPGAKPTERRRFSRVGFSGPGEITQDMTRAPVKLLDLSLHGALLEVFGHQQFDLTRPLHLRVSLAENTHIDMTVVTAHQTADNIGVVCQTIDEVSIGHLRRLIELNLGDAEAADRELAELFYPNGS